MHWVLLTIKGNFREEYSYFKGNTSLWDTLRRNDISYVSTLDSFDFNDMEIIAPLHAFLRFYYPFYREEDQYQSPKNPLTSMIMRNLGSPEYMKFFFEELNIHGPNGPYAIVFTGNSVLIKYLGQGGWNDREVSEYFRNKEVSPPIEWTRNYPNSFLSISDDFYDVDINYRNDDEMDSIVLNSEFIPNTNESKIQKVDKQESSNREFEDQFIFKGGLEKLEFMLESHYDSIPPEIHRFLETVRRERLEQGFKMLLKATSYMNLYEGIRKKPQFTNAPLPNLIIHLNEFEPYHITVNNQILHFEPLQKALYILFLKYPDGIILSHLTDYKNTLLDIYLSISHYENTTSMAASINRLCNPLENSLNEKISRINRTIYDFFYPLGFDHNSYRIIGKKGEPKMIMAAKDLVIWK